MTIRCCCGCLDRHAVLTQDLHSRAIDRLAVLDRHQKDVAAAIDVLLRQNSDVRDEKKSAVANRIDRFLFRRVPTARGEKEKAALAPAIRWFAKMLGKIKRRIIRFPFVFDCNWLLLQPDTRDIFLIEQMGIAKFRVFEFALGLADEMVDLTRSDTRDFKFDARQSA